MFEGKSEAALVSGISVLQSLLEYKRHCANLQPPVQASNMNESGGNSDFEGMPRCLSDQQVFNKLEVASEPVSSLDAERLAKCVRQVHAAIIHRLSDFHEILFNPPPKEMIETTVGKILPLGSCRLEVAHLIRALVSSNNPEINSKLVELKTLPLLIVSSRFQGLLIYRSFALHSSSHLFFFVLSFARLIFCSSHLLFLVLRLIFCSFPGSFLFVSMEQFSAYSSGT